MLVENTEILEQVVVLAVVANRDYGVGHNVFKWGVAKNIRILKREAKDIEMGQEPKEDYAKEYWEFMQKRERIIQANSVLDENGRRVFPPQHRIAFLKIMAELEPEYKNVITKHEKTLLDYREILKAKTDVNYHKIDCELIPDAMLASEQAILMDMFNEPKNSQEESVKVKAVG